MKPITIVRQIAAPRNHVFHTVANSSNMSKALPHVVKIEYLTDQTSGLGTTFRETRLMGKKEVMTELEITEFQEPERVRYLADSHGANWDTVFEFQENGEQTTMTMTMEARSYKLMAKIMNKLFRGMIAKAVAKDMDLLKEYCEQTVSEAVET